MTQQPWGQQPAQRPQAWGQQQPQWGQGQPAWGQPVAQARTPQGYQPTPYQAQPGGYPQPAQPGYPQPPRSGGHGMKLLLLGLVAVIAVGFFFVTLMSYLGGSDEQAGPEPLPTPEIGQTSAPPTGVPDPDLDPPPLPVPKTWDEAEQWLVDNAFYKASVQVPTNCTLGRVDVETADPQALEDHLNNLTGCLAMVWNAPMEQAGFQMPRPPVTVYSEPITTACGQSELYNAFYCPGDQRVYYATNIHEVFRKHNPEVIDNAFLPDNVIGHEFGHAIQARTGILIAYSSFRSQASKEDGLELSRRSEVQADCFSGMFLNAVAQASQITDAERVGLADVSEAIGDDSLSGDPSYLGDHGQGKNRRAWFETGNTNTAVGVCNTWTAPSSQVR